jgi:membrane protein YqaA with SNARE-associated domain
LSVFSALYDRALSWAAHPHAERYLAGLSFAESSFFPIPPDVMLAPMTLAQPERGWRFAFLTTVASVTGGIAGYAIGWWGLDAIEPLLRSLGYWDSYIRSTEWFETWGFLAVLAAGFTPIPYKIFTIAAGALHLLLPVFVVASLVGRGGRFFLVAGLVVWGGEPMQRRLRQHVDTLGWLLIVAVAGLGIVLLFRMG